MRTRSLLPGILLGGLLAGLAAACSSKHQNEQVPEPATEQPELITVTGLRTDHTEQQRRLSKRLQSMEQEAADAYHSVPVLPRRPIAPPPPPTSEYRESYQRPDDNPVQRVSEQPVSTFSIDVDTASYANTRRWLNQGRLPPRNAVRVEELINYFDYQYPAPDDRNIPFHIDTELAPAPWNQQAVLLKVGIQGYQTPNAELPPANLVFLVDVSGSMRSADKLPLLKQALKLLTRQLDRDDSIAIVVYAGSSGVVLEPTAGNHKHKILNALERLEAGGSTNGGAGIQLAYRLARERFKKGGVNRVILATDGDFNVGVTDHDALIERIERERQSGIALTALGFGTGNINDHLLEQLADKGDGNYTYIDRLNEANKVLVNEMGSTLMTIAKDVKIQIEFNPAQVAEYRLIGYENRLLNEEDFDNDRVDAGEIGAGHSVTALYELVLTDSEYRRLPERRYAVPQTPEYRPNPAYRQEIAHLRVRYKTPDSDRSQLIELPLNHAAIERRIAATSDDFRFAAAVAAFGEQLRDSKYLGDFHYTDTLRLARSARGGDPWGYRGEFLQLVSLADSLSGETTIKDEEEPRLSQTGNAR